MILPKVRDLRFVTIRRGGSLADSDHHLLALWAASCAEHVLDFFESAQPQDPRPRQAIEHARAWVLGEVTMTQARAAGGQAMGAARDLRGAARHAAYAAGQAGAVAHVAAHDLGAAAYAIKAVRAAAPEGRSGAAGRLECRWQRDQLPEAIRELVLDDQRLRHEICWSVFDPLSSQTARSPDTPGRISATLGQGCTSDPFTVQRGANVVNTMSKRDAVVTESDGGRKPDHVLCIGLAARPNPSLTAPDGQDLG